MATRAATIILLIGWASALGTQAQQTASERPPSPLVTVEAVVVGDDAAGTPLRKVRVVVTWTGGRAAPVSTDERGRFSVQVPRGAYHTIALTKAGYAPQRIGREPDDAAAPVVLRMPKGAAITGTIIDPSGAPVPRVAVRVRRTDADGKTYSTGEYQTDTDDRGAFRIGSLPAGRYAVMGRRPVLGEPVDPDTVVEVAAGGEIGIVRIHEGAAATERLVTSFAAGFNAGAQPPGTFSRSSPVGLIEGRALDESGRIAPAVLVRAVAIAGGISPVAAADAEGRYALRVPPGTYRLVASRPTPQALAIPPDGPGQVVVVANGQRLTGVDLTSRSGGVLTGTVVDESGEPLEGFLVQAYPATERAGRIQVGPISATNARRTDDRGRYRLFDLAPGTYYVVTRAASPESHGEVLNQVEFLYPSTTSPSAAVPIDVQQGAESDATITVSPGLLGRVEGHIVDAAGRPFQGLVRLVSRGRDGVPVGGAREGTSEAGSFSFSNVPPGEYVVQASGRVAGPDQPDVFTAPMQFGAAFVNAAADATTSATLRLSTGSVLRGQVAVAGAPGDAIQAPLAVVPLVADPHISWTATRAAVSVQPDGSFEIRDLFGPTRIAVDAPAGWRLQSIYIDGINAADDPVVFGTPGQSRNGVEAVITRGGAEISGRVSGDAAATAGALVAVGPGDPERWHERSRFVEVTVADGQGDFTLSNLPAGQYIVIAVDAGSLRPGMRALSRGEVRLLVPGATHVSVAENGRATVDVRVTRLP